MTEAAMVPVVSLYALFQDEMGKGRLRQQLAAARADADASRALIKELITERDYWRRFQGETATRRVQVEAERNAMALVMGERALEQVNAAIALERARELRAQSEAQAARFLAEREELREAYRRELESNGKLRAEVERLKERIRLSPIERQLEDLPF